jgi:hypothetical protein
MLQEIEQQVILITKGRDEYQTRVEQLSQEVASQFDRFHTLIWNHELLSPPSFSLFRAYELQRNLLLKVLDLERYCQLDSSRFDTIWRVTKNQVNQCSVIFLFFELSCEILCERNLFFIVFRKLEVFRY